MERAADTASRMGTGRTADTGRPGYGADPVPGDRGTDLTAGTGRTGGPGGRTGTGRHRARPGCRSSGYGGRRRRPDGPGAPARRRHRGLTITAIVVVVLLILLVVADRVAAGIAENEVANQIKSAGFPVKPKVTIAGFPVPHPAGGA